MAGSIKASATAWTNQRRMFLMPARAPLHMAPVNLQWLRLSIVSRVTPRSGAGDGGKHLEELAVTFAMGGKRLHQFLVL